MVEQVADPAALVEKRRLRRNERDRGRRAANPEAAREKGRRWYGANKEKAAESARTYYEANKEAILEKNRAYRAANKEELAEKSRKWSEANKERRAETGRVYNLRREFGMSPDAYGRKHELQKGRCEICGKPETNLDHRTGKPLRLAVDHDHDTQIVRSLLCRKCNQVLGLLQDSPTLLRKALSYLEHWSYEPDDFSSPAESDEAIGSGAV